MAAEDSLLNSLIEKEIPDGMQALVDSHMNLANLAAYCKENYRQNSDKGKVLQETKRYASQSLASVAYQVHSLAVNMLQMMDQQMIQLKKMEASVAGVSLTVDIHKEKVARRKIGLLTASKNVTKGHKIVAPAQQEKQRRYKREEIDYSSLDDIGHGIRTEPKKAIIRRPSQSSTSSGQMKGSLSGSEGYGSSSNSINEKPGSRTPLPPPIPPPVAPTVPSSVQHNSPPPPYNNGSYYGHPPPPPPVEDSIAPQPSTVGPAPPPPPFGGTMPPPPPPPAPPAGGPMISLPPTPLNSELMPPPPLNSESMPPPPPPIDSVSMPSPPSGTGGVMPPPPPPLPASKMSAPPAPPLAPPAPPLAPPAPPLAPPAPPLVLPSGMPPPPPASMLDAYDDGFPNGQPPPPPPGMMDDSNDQYDMPLPPTMDDLYDVPPVHHSYEPPGYEAGFLTATTLYKVKALYDYAKDKDDELDLRENEVVSVVKENDDGWLDGIAEDGRKGLFPGNYIVRI